MAGHAHPAFLSTRYTFADRRADSGIGLFAQTERLEQSIDSRDSFCLRYRSMTAVSLVLLRCITALGPCVPWEGEPSGKLQCLLNSERSQQGIFLLYKARELAEDS